MAKQVVPFLRMYQTDKPMLPFINADLFRMLKVLISRFMKPASLSLITSSAELLKLDLDKAYNRQTANGQTFRTTPENV